MTPVRDVAEGDGRRFGVGFEYRGGARGGGVVMGLFKQRQGSERERWGMLMEGSLADRLFDGFWFLFLGEGWDVVRVQMAIILSSGIERS